jgi:tetratricopeptide (TPR) repeat protein
LAVSFTLFSGQARCQERDSAAAQALFDQGRELSSQGKYAEACPKFQESNRLDPGIGTQFHLADCYEQSGRVASAWAAFLEVASQARATGQIDREKAATKRAEKLQPRLPRLVVNVPEGSKTPGLEIRRNGMLVGSAQWGTPVAVDPGEVELTATAPGKQTLRQTLRVEEGKTASYNLPALAQGEGAAAAPAEAAKAATPAASASPSLPPPAPAPVPPPDGDRPAAKSGNGPWVVTLAGIGVVGLGLGTTFAILAKSKYNDSLNDCDADAPNLCGASGMELRNDARTKGDIATVSFIVGGAALAGAGVVWLAGGSSKEKHGASPTRLRATPALAPNLAALFVQGRF